MKIQCPKCFHEFGVKKKKSLVIKGSLEDKRLVAKTRISISKGVQTQI